MFLSKQIAYWEWRAEKNLRRAWTIVFILMSLCFSLPLVQHFANLWKKEHYQFAPVLLAACCAIGIGRWREARQGKLLFSKFRIHPIPTLLSVLSFWVAVWINSPWCGFLSLIAFSWMLARNVPFLSGPVLLLAIMLPLPLMMDQDVVHGLQRISSRGASVLLDLAGIAHLPEGNVVETSDRRFFVEEACSGFGSVYLLVAIAGLIIVLKRLRLCVALPLLLSAPAWAVAANIVRIFAVVWAHERRGLNLAAGTNHELLGIGTYVLAVLGLMISEQALLFFLTPIGGESRETASTRRRKMEQWLIESWDKLTNGNWLYLQTQVLRRGISGISLSSGGAPVFCNSLLLLYLGGWGAVEGYRYLHTNLLSSVHNGGVPDSDSSAPVLLFGRDFLSQSLPVSQTRIMSYESRDSGLGDGMTERWVIEYQQREWVVESTGPIPQSKLQAASSNEAAAVEQTTEMVSDTNGRPYRLQVDLVDESLDSLHLNFTVHVGQNSDDVSPEILQSAEPAGRLFDRVADPENGDPGIYRFAVIAQVTSVPDQMTRQTLQNEAWRILASLIAKQGGTK